MYDLSQPNAAPGKCVKCKGSGVYRWGGAMVNGVWHGKKGPCHSCGGSGRQSAEDIARNHSYNRHKIAQIV